MKNAVLSELDRELHDLCQPLTVLQCQLELAQMMGDPKSLKEAVDAGVVESQRIVASVARMREMLEWKDEVLGG
jgi:glucose-6-phosphate-specific signal transduction histidine kinase